MRNMKPALMALLGLILYRANRPVNSRKGIWRVFRRGFFAGLCSLSAVITLGCSDKQPEKKPLTDGKSDLGFAQDIKKIMSKYCFECHGIKNKEAKLDLRTLGSILSGGESGPAIVPGHPDKSILLDMIHNEHMPPEGELLATEEIERIRQWIASGARP